MKNKKIVIIFSSLLIILLIGGYYAIKIVKNKKEEENITAEYTPQEEISEDQLRQTIVSLYFQSKETKELVPEARLIDIKEIINDPCDKLVQLLIDGPKNEKEERIISENTKLNKSYMDNDCVVLDFSSELLNYNKAEENGKENLINSLVNTLTQLTEINSVKILINGNENDEFNEIYSLKNNN
ncbi:MAG: GerMN domain-containing protein [Clostridia bacterium]|nr:GerMN domain-containing protein [Clostridia bacterium]